MKLSRNANSASLRGQSLLLSDDDDDDEDDDDDDLELYSFWLGLLDEDDAGVAIVVEVVVVMRVGRVEWGNE